MGRLGSDPAAAFDATLLGALERASGAIARLDQALDNHPLRTAFLYRTRLEAVRHQASVDGHGIDPWHLAAVLEGLRLRMDNALRIVDRGQIFEAARSALTLHQWLVEPDFDQEGEIQEAERHLANAAGLVGVGEALWSWLDSGRTRPPVRGALVRFWTKNRFLRAPVPLTGPRALSAEAPHGRADWMVAFLEALAGEATDYTEMLRSLERGWSTARARIPAQRSTSRAALAVDVMAATPLISATTLAKAIGTSIKLQPSCWTGSSARRSPSRSRTGRRGGCLVLRRWPRCVPRRAGRCPGEDGGGPDSTTSQTSWLRRPRRYSRFPASRIHRLTTARWRRRWLIATL